MRRLWVFGLRLRLLFIRVDWMVDELVEKALISKWNAALAL
jgi:hypothetical protein